MNRSTLALAGIPLLLALGATAHAAKKDEPTLFEVPRSNGMYDARGAGADRVPDLRRIHAHARPDGLEVGLRLHEDVPAWEHLVQVLVAKKDGKEPDRVVRIRSATEWVVKAAEEKPEGKDAKAEKAEKAAKDDKPKEKYPREVATGALVREGASYTFTVPWSALPEGDLWVWAEAQDWDPEARSIAEAAAKESEGAAEGAKSKKAEKKPMEPLNLSDRAPDGSRVLLVSRGAPDQS
ncbi:hypothetical protein L6R50_18325 [Myxococcota bacterium]|nr:hypothetical protein [Myxococcota bacterium]